MDHHAQVDHQFGSQAQAYLDSPVHARGPDLAQLAAFASTLPAGAHVLDMGCGAGHASFTVAPYAAEVTAYDLSEAMLAVVREAAAARGLRGIGTRQGPTEHLPFAAATFDLVISRYSAHHWSDPAAALREAARVLKPDGQLCFIDVVGPHGPHAALLDTHLQALELMRDSSHVRDYNADEWHAMLRGAGFAPLDEHRWPLPLDFQSWITRMRTPPVLEAALRQLLANAPAEVQRHYAIQADSLDFTLETAMFVARRHPAA